MSKYEYTNEIAKELVAQGFEAEAKEIEKANGIIKNAVCVRMPGEKRAVTLYVDEMYDDNVPVEEAAASARYAYDQHKLAYNPDVESIMDYEYVKKNLVLRLYGSSTNAEVYRSAERYGFDGLILIPYVNMTVTDDVSGAVKVNREFLKIWNVDEDTLFEDAMRNTKADVVEKTMRDTLGNMGKSMMFLPDIFDNILIISNKSCICGASAILGKLDELKGRYENGFYVIPSSIHETIVIPYTEDSNIDELSELVGMVNTECVLAEEVLGTKAYKIA